MQTKKKSDHFHLHRYKDSTIVYTSLLLTPTLSSQHSSKISLRYSLNPCVWEKAKACRFNTFFTKFFIATDTEVAKRTLFGTKRAGMKISFVIISLTKSNLLVYLWEDETTAKERPQVNDVCCWLASVYNPISTIYNMILIVVTVCVHINLVSNN